jgi:hypothetical protein
LFIKQSYVDDVLHDRHQRVLGHRICHRHDYLLGVSYGCRQDGYQLGGYYDRLRWQRGHQSYGYLLDGLSLQGVNQNLYHVVYRYLGSQYLHQHYRLDGCCDHLRSQRGHRNYARLHDHQSYGYVRLDDLNDHQGGHLMGGLSDHLDDRGLDRQYVVLDVLVRSQR